MPCYEIDGLRPVIHPSAFVHPDAVLIGDVIVGPRCYVAPLASLRGDFGRIELEEGSNVQDCCVMHAFPNNETRVEVDGHVGHGAILHGCRVGRGALIGMHAVVMDNAVIGEAAIVAACAFVKAEMHIPPHHLAAGMPAKVLRPLTEQEAAWKRIGTRTYQELVVRSQQTLAACEPLTEIEAGRPRIEIPGVVPLAEARKQA